MAVGLVQGGTGGAGAGPQFINQFGFNPVIVRLVDQAGHYRYTLAVPQAGAAAYCVVATGQHPVSEVPVQIEVIVVQRDGSTFDTYTYDFAANPFDIGVNLTVVAIP